MRDFSNSYRVEGTAARNRSACENRTYRRHGSYDNVVMFPGTGAVDHANKPAQPKARICSSSPVPAHVDSASRDARSISSSSDARQSRPTAYRASGEEVGQRTRARRANANEGSVRDYIDYFSSLTDMMITNVREGSIAGSSMPCDSKVQCAIAHTAVSAVCLLCAFL